MGCLANTSSSSKLIRVRRKGGPFNKGGSKPIKLSASPERKQRAHIPSMPWFLLRSPSTRSLSSAKHISGVLTRPSRQATADGVHLATPPSWSYPLIQARFLADLLTVRLAAKANARLRRSSQYSAVGCDEGCFILLTPALEPHLSSPRRRSRAVVFYARPPCGAVFLSEGPDYDHECQAIASGRKCSTKRAISRNATENPQASRSGLSPRTP